MSFQIITPINKIEQMAMSAFCLEANKFLPSLGQKIRRDIVANIGDIFEFSKEYQSLLATDGDLRAQFGLTDAKFKLREIIKTLANSTLIDYIPLRVRGNSFTGGYRVYAFQSDFSDILSMNQSYQGTSAGKQLPWLEWLLLEGDKIIIYDYYFNPHVRQGSRTGEGVMSIGKNKYWRVPPQYSGTMRDNWITRAVNAYIDDIGLIIETAMIKALR